MWIIEIGDQPIIFFFVKRCYDTTCLLANGKVYGNYISELFEIVGEMIGYRLHVNLHFSTIFAITDSFHSMKTKKSKNRMQFHPNSDNLAFHIIVNLPLTNCSFKYKKISRLYFLNYCYCITNLSQVVILHFKKSPAFAFEVIIAA